MPFTLVVNGQERAFNNLALPLTLAAVVAEMNLKGDRVAVEHNGAIIQRARWEETPVGPGDRLEVVHFVGGGTGEELLTAPGFAATTGLYIISVIGRRLARVRSRAM